MNGFGFKMTFDTPEEAKEYKEMNRYIIQHDNYKVHNEKGLHEQEDKQ